MPSIQVQFLFSPCNVEPNSKMILICKFVIKSGDVVLIEGQSGGSIVGITPGAVLEKKSVRDMAAGLNRLGGKRKDFLRVCFRFFFISFHFACSFGFFMIFFRFLFCLKFLVDIIKPKPPQALPRTSQSFSSNVENRHSTTRPESLPKPLNINVKPPPEVLRRIAGKEITTTFEV